MGRQLITREDDSEPVIRQRLEEYDQPDEAAAGIFSRQSGVPSFEVDGSDGPSAGDCEPDLQFGAMRVT